MEIRQSAEDYLESILVLSKKGGGVRSIDIATRLGVSKPSVSHAMKLLRHGPLRYRDTSGEGGGDRQSDL